MLTQTMFTFTSIAYAELLKAWQLKLAPVEDGPFKGSAKAGSKAAPQQQAPAKEYGADLPFKLPAPDRSADDVVLALCVGQGSNGAVPADDRCCYFPLHGGFCPQQAHSRLGICQDCTVACGGYIVAALYSCYCLACELCTTLGSHQVRHPYGGM